MGKWEEKTIGDVASVKSSKRIFKNEYVTEGVPFYRSKEVGQLHDTGDTNSELFISKSRYNEIKNKFGLPREGDLLLTSVGTIGKTWIVDNRKFYYKDGNLTQLSVYDNFCVEFLQYFFKSPLFLDVVFDKVNGTAYNALTITKIKDLKIPLPPLPEQRRIVAKLDELFEKIDAAVVLLEENIAHTQALMGSVLDEEFGKLAIHNKPIKSFCKDPKKDMVGGPFGSNLKASEYVDKGYPIIRLQNVGRFRFKEKNIMFVTEEKAEFLSSHSYRAGDIVMTKLGDPLGKCCIVNNVHGVGRGVISSDIIRIRIDETKHYKPYVVAGINSEYFIKQLKSKTQGSTRPRVTLKEVREMQLPMLERKDQVIAAERIDSILKLQANVIKSQTQKLEDLKQLKSSLLDQAFKGEL